MTETEQILRLKRELLKVKRELVIQEICHMDDIERVAQAFGKVVEGQLELLDEAREDLRDGFIDKADARFTKLAKYMRIIHMGITTREYER
jgi:hypothetical protein